jgi:hypothetical protein
MVLQNVGIILQHYMASQLRRPRLKLLPTCLYIKILLLQRVSNFLNILYIEFLKVLVSFCFSKTAVYG